MSETHLLWKADVGANVSSPVIHDGHLYWTSDRNTTVYCLSLQDGAIKYSQRVREQPYASTLLADGRLPEAEEVYRADLERHPNNAWSLLGLQQALEQQSRTAEAAALASRVHLAWARADVSPVASCYCHPEATRRRIPRLPAESSAP